MNVTQVECPVRPQGYRRPSLCRTLGTRDALMGQASPCWSVKPNFRCEGTGGIGQLLCHNVYAWMAVYTVNCFNVPRRRRIFARCSCVTPSRTLLGIPEASANTGTPPTRLIGRIAIGVHVPPQALGVTAQEQCADPCHRAPELPGASPAPSQGAQTNQGIGEVQHPTAMMSSVFQPPT